MRFVNDTLQAVVVMACEKHAPAILEKLRACPQGNWFVLPALPVCRMGYWNNVSPSHEGQGCAIFGFVERVSLSQTLAELAADHEDGGLCPDCVAYEWNITPSHIAATAKDPVCGHTVACAEALTECHEGELFFFCTVACRDRFHRSPQSFIAPRRPQPVAVAEPEASVPSTT